MTEPAPPPATDRLSAVEWLTLIRQGGQAYREGRPVTACPYQIILSEWAAIRGEVWIRGYVIARANQGE